MTARSWGLVTLLLMVSLTVFSSCGGGSSGKDDALDADGEVQSLDVVLDGVVPSDTAKDLDTTPEADTDLIGVDLLDTLTDTTDVGPDTTPDAEVVEPEVTDPDTEISQDVEPQCDLACTSHEECEPFFSNLSYCESARCLYSTVCGQNQCERVLTPAPACCDGDQDCEDANDNECLINDRCVNHVCYFDPSPAPECCKNELLFHFDFEDGQLPSQDKLQILDFDTEDTVAWRLTESPCGDGLALYLGDEVCQTYYNGQLLDCQPVEEITCQSDGECPAPLNECNLSSHTCKPFPESDKVKTELRIPEVNVPEDAFVAVSFRVWLDTEPANGGDIQFDLFELKVEQGGETVSIPYSSEEDKSTNGHCVYISADLSGFAGQSLDLVWSFDTMDGFNNFFGGIFLDDIRVWTYCETCLQQSECNDEDPCTQDFCAAFSNTSGGMCINELEDPYCRACPNGVADCEGFGAHPGDPCWIPSCTEEELCVWSADSSCCDEDLNQEVFTNGFESGGLGGWTVDSQEESTSYWQLDAAGGAPDEGPDADTFSLYFGDLAAGNYDCGLESCYGSVTSPTIDLSSLDAQHRVMLSFMLNMSTEWDAVEPSLYPEENADNIGFDVLYIEAVTNMGSTVTEIWNSDQVQGSTRGEYVLAWADLTPVLGQSFKLRFRFDSGNAIPANNDFGGVRVDEIRIETVCDQICMVGADCPAGPDCTESLCQAGSCFYEEIPECCSENLLSVCDDDNPCTDDMCNVELGVCTHSYSGDPQCCTAMPGILTSDFEQGLDAAGWIRPSSGTLCGDQECGEGESCETCPLDCECNVEWQVTDHKAFAGTAALYFGSSETWTYANGNLAARGTVVSPEVVLPAYGIPKVRFSLWLDTDMTQSWDLFVEPSVYDLLTLQVEKKQGQTWSAPVEVWNSHAWDVKGSTWDPQQQQVVWKQIELGLRNLGLEGKTVRFRLVFDSYDQYLNSFGGVYVDDFTVLTICSNNYECTSSVECPEQSSDSPSCTIEMCDFGECSFQYNELKEDCCAQDVVAGAEFNFDVPNCSVQGWTTTASTGLVTWQPDDYLNKTDGGTCAMYFGNAVTHSYDAGGAQVIGTLMSPEIEVTDYINLEDTVTENNKLEVSFWLWMSVEDKFYWADTLTISVANVPLTGYPAENFVTLWTKPCSALTPENGGDSECLESQIPAPCDTYGCVEYPWGEWKYMAFELDFTPGGNVGSYVQSGFPIILKFKFHFDSWGGGYDNDVGIFFDEFKVRTICQ